MKFSRLSIRRKNTLIILAVVFIALLISFIINFYINISTYRARYISGITGAVNIIKSSVAEGLKNNQREITEARLKQLTHFNEILKVVVYNSNGKVFSVFLNNTSNIPLPKTFPESKKAISDGFLFQTFNLIVNNQKIGELKIVASTIPIKEEIFKLTIFTILLFIGLLILSIYTGYRLSVYITKPIKTLADTALEISKTKDYSVRVKKIHDDEIGALFDNFNHMITQIANNEETIKRFSTNLEKKILERTRRLRDSNEKFRSIFEFAPIGIAIFDIESNLLDVNQKFERFIGYSKVELLHLGINEVSHPIDMMKELDYLQELLSGRREYYTFEKRYIHKNRNIIWGDFTASLVKDHKGKISFGIGMLIDITKRKKAEEDLLTNKEKLNLALSGGNSFIWEYKLAERVISFNDEFYKYFGLKTDVETQSIDFWVNKVFENDRHVLNTAFNNFIEGKTGIITFQIRLKTSETGFIWLLVTGKTSKMSSTGNPLIVSGTAVDISDRKKTEEDLKFEIDFNKSLAELAKQILTPDLSLDVISTKVYQLALRITNSKYGFVSIIDEKKPLNCRAFTNMFKNNISEPENLFLKDCDETLMAFKKFLCHINEAFYSNSPETQSDIVEFFKGDFNFVNILSAPSKTDNNLLGYIAIANKNGEFTERDLISIKRIADIFAFAIIRKRIEKDLVSEKQKAQAANRAKSIFLANMSHEIRTPMNVVSGFADLLYNQVSDPTLKGYVKSIKSSGRTLLNLINDILDLSKIEAGKMDLHVEPVNIISVFNEIKNMFSLKTEKKLIDFIVDINDNFPNNLLLDELRLTQILFNLVGNSVKFTDKGHVKLKAGFTEKSKPAKALNKYFDINISVEDTGIGIPEEMHDIIFDAFRQQSESDTRKHGGTGLGLTITKKLVEMMNGTISLRSEQGKGSIFVIEFRNTRQEISGEVETSQYEIEYNNIVFDKSKILIVDDIVTNRQLLKSFLMPAGVEVIEAEDGQKAIFLTKEFAPDIILMDLRMPVMDGYKATQILKNNDKYKNIPVIAISASLIQLQPENDKNQIFDGFVQKPVQGNELFHVLTKYLKFKKKRIKEKKQPKPYTEIKKEKIPKEVYNKMVSEFEPLWKKVQKSQNISEIEKFSLALETFGNENKIKTIQEYGKILTLFSENIDIENLKIYIDKFPEIIESIETEA